MGGRRDSGVPHAYRDRVTHYDLVVIGTGSGNTVVDEAFDGWSVAVVERRTFGGTCLNRGCIPSKMLVRTAEHVLTTREGARFGVDAQVAGVDWPAVRDRVFGRTDHDAADGERARRDEEQVTVLLGEARFTGERALQVRLDDGGLAEVTADRVVVAVGSRPVVPPVEGLDDLRGPDGPAPAGRPDDPGRADWYTSDDVMRMPELPRRLGVLGGGYVGTELAHVFEALGSQVVQVESAGTLLADHDAEIASSFTAFARTRWDVRTATELARVSRAGSGGVVLHLATADDDAAPAGEVEVDALLLAVGRTPNSDRLDVAAAGIETDDDGVVVVDRRQRTSADGVWALGDVSSRTPLKHSANQDARVVRQNLLHPDEPAVSDHRFVPDAVFAEPQVARVGSTEAQAREQGVDVAVAVVDLADTAYGWAMEDDRRPSRDDGARHLVKLVADRGTGRLVGAHLVAPQASVLLQPLLLAMSLDLPVAGLARAQYWIHPALGEVVEQALLALEDELAA